MAYEDSPTIGNLNAKKAKLVDSSYVKGLNADYAVIKGKAKVDNITVKNLLDLSENAKVGNVIVTGENPKVSRI